MRRFSFGLVTLALTSAALGATACDGGSAAPPPPAPAAAAAAVVSLAPENITTVAMRKITSGPMISGELTPAREATVRAQVGGSLVSLTVDRGQPVKSGQVVARISSRDLEDAHASALAAVKSAETALTIAKIAAVSSLAARIDGLNRGLRWTQPWPQTERNSENLRASSITVEQLA